MVVTAIVPILDADTGSVTVDGITYEMSDEGTAKITGYEGESTHLEIPVTVLFEDRVIPVTAIDDAAFFECESLVNVYIPASISEIGEGPFRGCESLISIEVDPDNPAYDSVDGVLFEEGCVMLVQYPYGLEDDYAVPEGVVCIGTSAFRASKVMQVTIPDSVREIRFYAFAYCEGLTSVDLGEGVESIEFNAFVGTALETVTIPDSVIRIGDNAFQQCESLTSVDLGKSVDLIGQRAFANTALESVTIPDSVRVVDNFAFCECKDLSTLDLGDGVEHLGVYAFASTALESVSLPASVAYIGVCAFLDTQVAGFEVDTRNNVYSSMDGVLFSKDGKTLIQSFPLLEGEYIVPDGVETIGFYSFHGSKIASLVLSDTVSYIDDHAFSGCEGLTNVDLNRVVTLGENSFEYCQSLESIEFPDTVVAVGDHAFTECTGLKTVNMGKGLTEIGLRTFYAAGAMEGFIVDPDNPSYKAIDGILYSKDGTVLLMCPGGMSSDLIIPEGVTRLESGSLDGCYNIGSISIPASLAEVDPHEFVDCDSVMGFIVDPDNPSYVTVDGVLFSKDLSTLVRYPSAMVDDYTVPEGVLVIASGAFYGVNHVKNIVLPDGLMEIGADAFGYGFDLETINLPDSLRSIGDFAFWMCRSLESVTIPEGVELGYSVFYQVCVPEGVTPEPGGKVGHEYVDGTCTICGGADTEFRSVMYMVAMLVSAVVAGVVVLACRSK